MTSGPRLVSMCLLLTLLVAMHNNNNDKYLSHANLYIYNVFKCAYA